MRMKEEIMVASAEKPVAPRRQPEMPRDGLGPLEPARIIDGGP
jgi:hypothetical protein